MKIDIEKISNDFTIKPCQFCGIDAFLINPKIDAEWNQSNLHLRSLIVDINGNIISSGFKKFFNYLEHQKCYPDPNDYSDWIIEEKMDGSLVIIDYHNNQLNIRTRGTVSYVCQNNFKDFEILIKKYPLIESFLKHNNHLSLLFEIITPNNTIIIKSSEVKFFFLNAINKNTLEMISDQERQKVCNLIGSPAVPERFNIENNNDLNVIYQKIKLWKNKEGIVLTYNNNQNQIKVKSDWYLFLHRMKSNLSSVENLIDIYIDLNMPSSEDFFSYIEKEYDFEIANYLKTLIEKISLTGSIFKRKKEEIQSFILELKKCSDRKEMAEKINSIYGSQKLSGFVFALMDGKLTQKNQIKKTFITFYHTA